MGLESRYEYIEGTSSKFWEIDPVRKEGEDFHVVRVKYGRIGTEGRVHTNVFSYGSAAERHRLTKINEKLRKGYKLKSAPKPAQKAQPIWIPSAAQTAFYEKSDPKPKVCQHVTITRSGNKYKCNACGDQVEFDKPQVAVEAPEFETKVRRFFAGAA